jgi:alpha-beta hydrolase superfamily lysophospholipase
MLEPTRLPDVLSSYGHACALWEWVPAPPHRGLVVIFHGLGAHARFPTVRVAADLLASHGFVVCGIDFPGHGASEGLRGYIPDAECLIVDGRARSGSNHLRAPFVAPLAAAANKIGWCARRLAAYRASVAAHPDLPTFLLGSSMGGAIAVGVAERAVTGAAASTATQEEASAAGAPAAAADASLAVPRGIVLLAPMLAPAASPILVQLTCVPLRASATARLRTTVSAHTILHRPFPTYFLLTY